MVLSMGRRPAKTVRDFDKVAYTRYSRSKPRKSYLKVMPHRHLHIYHMGLQNEKAFDTILDLVAENDITLRDCAAEAGRVTINKILEKRINSQYYFRVLRYAFHVIRENKMLAGAGADRLSKGMRHSFGRATDVAIRLKQNDALFRIYTNSNNIGVVKEALKKGINKLGGCFRIVVYPNGPRN